MVEEVCQRFGGGAEATSGNSGNYLKVGGLTPPVPPPISGPGMNIPACMLATVDLMLLRMLGLSE